MGGRKDFKQIAKVINDLSPDVVALQEVDINTTRIGGHDLLRELSVATSLPPPPSSIAAPNNVSCAASRATIKADDESSRWEQLGLFRQRRWTSPPKSAASQPLDHDSAGHVETKLPDSPAVLGNGDMATAIGMSSDGAQLTMHLGSNQLWAVVADGMSAHWATSTPMLHCRDGLDFSYRTLCAGSTVVEYRRAV
jgi:hypothetical protein